MEDEAMNTSADQLKSSVGVAPDQGVAIWYLNNRMTIKATGATTGGAFSLLEALLPPGTSPPLHIHRAEDEPMWVVDGVLTFRVGEETFGAGPGSFAFLPRDVPHTFVVEGTTTARVLILLVPAGGEGYFIEGGRPAEGDGMPPASSPDFAKLEEVAAKYHIEMIGPPLEPTERR
jgi:quercetin dioxygenase-like cupin family protein